MKLIDADKLKEAFYNAEYDVIDMLIDGFSIEKVNEVIDSQTEIKPMERVIAKVTLSEEQIKEAVNSAIAEIKAQIKGE